MSSDIMKHLHKKFTNFQIKDIITRYPKIIGVNSSITVYFVMTSSLNLPLPKAHLTIIIIAILQNRKLFSRTKVCRIL